MLHGIVKNFKLALSKNGLCSKCTRDSPKEVEDSPKFSEVKAGQSKSVFVHFSFLISPELFSWVQLWWLWSSQRNSYSIPAFCKSSHCTMNCCEMGSRGVTLVIRIELLNIRMQCIPWCTFQRSSLTGTLAKMFLDVLLGRCITTPPLYLRNWPFNVNFWLAMLLLPSQNIWSDVGKGRGISFCCPNKRPDEIEHLWFP